MANHVDLLDAIDRGFNSEELKHLCFVLRIDYDNLAGETKLAKARELIQHCERRDQMSALQQAVSEARPPVLPTPKESPTVDKARLAAVDALHQLLAAGGTLSTRAEFDTLGATLKALRNAVGKGRPPDAQAVRRLGELVAAARLSPADRRQAERWLRKLAGAPA